MSHSALDLSSLVWHPFFTLQSSFKPVSLHKSDPVVGPAMARWAKIGTGRVTTRVVRPAWPKSTVHLIVCHQL